ncbi:hypothetical protein SB748_28110 [Rhizobium sp. SIMBA_035]
MGQFSVIFSSNPGSALSANQQLADIATYRELWSGAALFADPNSKEAFATEISCLVRDEELRNRLGRLAQARSRAFTVEDQVASVRAIYQHVLSIAQAPTAMEYT